tara:strand:+ start:79 stop:303 length:225 start_codon:yes stop_codon:yes gene_type:complete
MRKRENMNKLKVDMNYKTGRRGENNCRIVSAGSELDKMYQQCYDDYMKVQEWNERKRPMQQEPKRDGSGEWILS